MKQPSNLLNGMMNKNGYEAPPVKLDPKRAELAGALTRTLINQALREVQAAKKAHESGQKGE
jgi:hypothetical protein